MNALKRWKRAIRFEKRLVDVFGGKVQVSVEAGLFYKFHNLLGIVAVSHAFAAVRSNLLKAGDFCKGVRDFFFFIVIEYESATWRCNLRNLCNRLEKDFDRDVIGDTENRKYGGCIRIESGVY